MLRGPESNWGLEVLFLSCFHTSMDYPIFLKTEPSWEFFIIVSEPSVCLHRGLGCRLPNLCFFKAFTLTLSGHVVASKALTVFQQFRRFSVSHYCDRSQFPMSLPRYLSSTPLYVLNVPEDNITEAHSCLVCYSVWYYYLINYVQTF